MNITILSSVVRVDLVVVNEKVIKDIRQLVGLVFVSKFEEGDFTVYNRVAFFSGYRRFLIGIAKNRSKHRFFMQGKCRTTSKTSTIVQGKAELKGLLDFILT